MRKSARQLGEDYGLTAQEMNYVLKEKGYLNGEPGEYSVTEKGTPFAEEVDYHRGTGGYAQYNRYWTTRSWDESIKNDLEVSSEMKSEARDAIAQYRKRQRDEIKAAREEANAKFLANQNSNEMEDDEFKNEDQTSSVSNEEVRGVLIIGGLIVLGFGIYKAVPHVMKWWKRKVSPKLKKTDDAKTHNSETDISCEIVCPACGGIMCLNKEEGHWRCHECDYSLSEKEFDNEYVFWFCDKCEAYLNNQPGFDINSDRWTCIKCGHDNDITDVNIVD